MDVLVSSARSTNYSSGELLIFLKIFSLENNFSLFDDATKQTHPKIHFKFKLYRNPKSDLRTRQAAKLFSYVGRELKLLTKTVYAVKLRGSMNLNYLALRLASLPRELISIKI